MVEPALFVCPCVNQGFNYLHVSSFRSKMQSRVRYFILFIQHFDSSFQSKVHNSGGENQRPIVEIDIYNKDVKSAE